MIYSKETDSLKHFKTITDAFTKFGTCIFFQKHTSSSLLMANSDVTNVSVKCGLKESTDNRNMI